MIKDKTNVKKKNDKAKKMPKKALTKKKLEEKVEENVDNKMEEDEEMEVDHNSEMESSSPPTKEKAKTKRKVDPKDADNEEPVKKKKSNNQGKTDEEKKLEREKQKKTREERRKKDKGSSDIFTLGQESKKIWEELRREDCPENKKLELCDRLYATVKGNISKIIFAHDTVRVIQCLMALGDEKIRESLFQELKGEMIPIIKSKYASFFALKLIKYGSKEQRAQVVQSWTGKIPELMKHKIANAVVECFYNDYANATQRNAMLQEFCGPEFKAFKENDIRNVTDLIAKHPDKRKDICFHLFNNTTTLINKGCYNHSLVHTVIYNCLKVVKDKERSELIEQLRDACVHVLHSHDGARLSMFCLWHGSAKDRKAIVKSFKTYIAKICSEEHGHLVLLAVFDAVDDTKLVGKAILGEMAEHLPEILGNKFGQKVVSYLFAPRSKTYFHPDVLEILKSGDGNANSKKDAEIRWNELAVEAAGKFMIKHLVENIKDFLFNNQLTLLLGAILNGERKNVNVEDVLKVLAMEAAIPFHSDDDEPNIVENTASHILLKKTIQKDKVRLENEGSDVSKTFSFMILENLNDESLDGWLNCNRGSFLIVLMLELENDEIKQKVQEKLKNWNKTLKKQTTKGGQVLREKLGMK